MIGSDEREPTSGSARAGSGVDSGTAGSGGGATTASGPELPSGVTTAELLDELAEAAGVPTLIKPPVPEEPANAGDIKIRERRMEIKIDDIVILVLPP